MLTAPAYDVNRYALFLSALPQVLLAQQPRLELVVHRVFANEYFEHRIVKIDLFDDGAFFDAVDGARTQRRRTDKGRSGLPRPGMRLFLVGRGKPFLQFPFPSSIPTAHFEQSTGLCSNFSARC